MHDPSPAELTQADEAVDRDRAQAHARHLAAIVQYSDDAILTKGLDGIITSWNQGATHLFGYSDEEAIGKPVTLLIPPDQLDEEPMILSRIRQGERIDHYETVRRHKNGSLLDISLTVSPIRDSAGKVIGASKVARDISERRRAHEQQQLLLREMDHRIKNLFSLASSVVRLSAQAARTPADLAVSVAGRLAALSRAHALTLTYPADMARSSEQPLHLHALIKTIVAPYERQTTEDQERITVHGADAPISTNTVTSLALLLHEFATNAAKYGALSTPNGQVRVDCRDDGSTFILAWIERGGPPVENRPGSEGFGGILMRSAVKSLKGMISYEWATEGLTIRVSMPRDRIVE